MLVHTYRWKAIAMSGSKEELEKIMAIMDCETHRITSNTIE